MNSSLASGSARPRTVPISCFIFTLNEEINLPHCLKSLTWCDDVVVIDSFSTDRTEAIAREAGAKFWQNSFSGFGDQRNWALAKAGIKYPWALILDADERVPSEMVEELATRLPEATPDIAAFRVRRRFHLWGKWLRFSSLYPTWVVRLVRVGRVLYHNRGHAETQMVDGRIDSLHTDLVDENHKGLEEWWARQDRYAHQEALYELQRPHAPLTHLFAFDPLRRREALKTLARRLPGRPVWYFLYSYLLRFGFLDGLAGLRYCRMKAAFHAMIARKKRELLRGGGLRNPPLDNPEKMPGKPVPKNG